MRYNTESVGVRPGTAGRAQQGHGKIFSAQASPYRTGIDNSKNGLLATGANAGFLGAYIDESAPKTPLYYHATSSTTA